MLIEFAVEMNIPYYNCVLPGAMVSHFNHFQNDPTNIAKTCNGHIWWDKKI